MTGLGIDPASPGGMVRMSSGLIVPEAVARATRKPTAVDLFCGAGGFSLGFIEAGFEVVCAVEWDVAATLTYLANLGQYPMRLAFATPQDKERLNRALEKRMKASKGKPVTRWRFDEGTVTSELACPLPTPGYNRPRERTPVRSFIFGDIREVSAELICETAGIEVGELDAVITSPPCQGFSTANRNHGPNDSRNLLAFESARLIRELRPRTYVLENVPNFAKMVLPHGPSVMDMFIEIADGFSDAETLRRSMLGMKGARAAVRRSKRRGKQDETAPAKRVRKTETAPTLFEAAHA